MTRITLDSLPDNWLERILHVPETDCWLWTGARTNTPTPYAKVSIKGATQRLHKHLWSLANPEFDPSLELPRLHRQCTTELCVNPEHWHVEPFRPEDPWTPNVLGRKRKSEIEVHAPPPEMLEVELGDDDHLEMAAGMIDTLLDHGRPGSLEEICALPQFSGIPETIVAMAARRFGLPF